MKMVLLLLALVFQYNTVLAQEKPFFPIKNCSTLAVDQFQYIYLCKDEEIYKFDNNFKKLAAYSNPLLSDITAIDVSNALNPILFYGETYRVVILDNRLNESTTLNLIDLGFPDPKLVSVSDEKNLWIYDQSRDKIIRYHIENGRQTNKSLNISQLLGMENTPTQMMSTFDNVFLNIPEKGLMIFDATGSFLKLVATKHIERFQIDGNRLIFLKEGKIQLIDLKSNQQKTLSEGYEEINSFYISGNKLYVLDKVGLQITNL
jgi:hypothetical protein